MIDTDNHMVGVNGAVMIRGYLVRGENNSVLNKDTERVLHCPWLHLRAGVFLRLIQQVTQ